MMVKRASSPETVLFFNRGRPFVRSRTMAVSDDYRDFVLGPTRVRRPGHGEADPSWSF